MKSGSVPESPLEVLADELAGIASDVERDVRSHVDRIVSDAQRKLAEVETRLLERRFELLQFESDIQTRIDTRLAEIKDGAPGEKGEPGETGLTGPQGETGERGADGIDGIDGINGKDGQDADRVEIEMLKMDMADLREQMASVKKSLRESTDAEFKERVQKAFDYKDSFQEMFSGITSRQSPNLNVNVPISMPKRGKEITTVEHDENGRVKRMIKHETD